MFEKLHQFESFLKFQNDQAKLGKLIGAFSLPSGYSCPFALDCMSKAHRITGKITDGKFTKFRCFSASDEARSPAARNARWYNWDLLFPIHNSEHIMTDLISASMPEEEIIRVHVGGEYFNQMYFNAWRNVAANFSDRIIYSYTKSIPYWIDQINNIPDNFRLTASFGGRCDNLIGEYNLKSALVVTHPRDAERLNLEIDHDDSHAIHGNDSFALLIHGTQPKGSKSAGAIKILKAEGIKFSYSNKRFRNRAIATYAKVGDQI